MKSEATKSMQQRKRRPGTPGEVVAQLLEEAELSQTELASRLGVSRVTVNELINNRRALTPDMAHRLGRFFGNGPQLWLNLQQQVDLWDALHLDSRAYESIEPLQNAA